MAENNFRIEAPKTRKILVKKDHYREYIEELEEDFHKRCGYCDAHQLWLDKRLFHIDHFAPKIKFKKRINNYENLIYSCSYCNLSKSKDWISECPDTPILNGIGYLNPRSEDYNEHFSRNEYGEIIPLTSPAKYMYSRLKFYLMRHRIIWSIDQLDLIGEEIKKIEQEREIPEEMKIKINSFLRKLNNLHREAYFQLKGGR